MPEIEISRTEKSSTYATGKRVASGFTQLRTEFSAGIVWMPDLNTKVDMSASRVSGTDIVFDKLAGGASVTFDQDSASYTLEKGGAAMRYEGPAASLVSVTGNTVEYLTGDGIPIVYNVRRTMVPQYASYDPTVKAGPSFRRIADQRGIDAFAFLQPKVYDPTQQFAKEILSGDVTFGANGEILTGFDFNKLAGGKTVRVDPTSTYGPASGDGYLYAQRNGNFWQYCRDVASLADASLTSGLKSTTATEGIADFGSRYNTAAASFINRSYVPFNTAGIGGGSVIDSAFLRLYVVSIENIGTAGRAAQVTACTIVSTTALADTDYVDTFFGTTVFGTNTFASLTAGATKDWTFNDDGEAGISKTGFTKLGLRHSSDTANVQPTDGDSNYAIVHFSEGATPPVLSVTYTLANAKNFLMMGVG